MPLTYILDFTLMIDIMLTLFIFCRYDRVGLLKLFWKPSYVYIAWTLREKVAIIRSAPQKPALINWYRDKSLRPKYRINLRRGTGVNCIEALLLPGETVLQVGIQLCNFTKQESYNPWNQLLGVQSVSFLFLWDKKVCLNVIIILYRCSAYKKFMWFYVYFDMNFKYSVKRTLHFSNHSSIPGTDCCGVYISQMILS